MSTKQNDKIKHPATYTDSFIPLFAERLQNCSTVYDPFGGTGKLALIKEHGYQGKIFCSELEPEWTKQYDGIDRWLIGDSAKTDFIKDGYFDAICTSPTYGNRMADHHEAKDASKRITYRHRLGRALSDENTGKMQWGANYKEKHIEIYKELHRVLKVGGIFILNISDHIRAGSVVKVAKWHKEALESLGFALQEELSVSTPRMGFGANSHLRVPDEKIFVFKKLRTYKKRSSNG